jgi:hypothetical protein
VIPLPDFLSASFSKQRNKKSEEKNRNKRLGSERRIYCYTQHIPERRNGDDRRKTNEPEKPDLKTK